PRTPPAPSLPIPMEPTDFIFCDNASDLPAIVESLQGSPTLFLDCEGSKLGLRTGRLSLISLGIPEVAPQQQRVYLINALALGTLGLRPIFDTQIQKVVFDGRMDQNALFYEHHVAMQNVMDLQLADIKSRRRRGEESTEQIGRLSPYF
ncbi:hypothetical protein DFH09DRAFT_886351, partial [Mycena vulgaris]